MAAFGAASTPAQELESVIANILNGVRVSEFNQYLLEFAETDAAWEASLGLFNSANPDVRFFAANIVYQKVRKGAQWGQLNEDQRNSIFGIMISHLGSETQRIAAAGDRLGSFLDRIVLCLAVVCSRAGGVGLYVNAAIERVDQGGALSTVGLEMLCALPAEVDSLDVASHARAALQDDLLTLGAVVLAKVNDIAVSGAWERNSKLHVLAMKVLRCWLLPLGMTLSRLYEDFDSCLRMVCSALQTRDGERVVEACAVLREISVVTDYPRPAVRDRAVLAVLQHVTSSAALLSPFFSLDAGDERVAHEICNSLVSLASHEASLVASPQHCSVEFFKLLLSCSQQRPRQIASLTFDVWLALADIPVAERHSYVAGDVFRALLHNLLDNCAYPADYSTSWDQSADDEDDLAEFRDHKHGIQDVLLVSFYALDAAFFDILEGRIAEATMMANGAVVVKDCWRLEAALYVLHSSMEAVRSSVNKKCSTARSFLARTVQLLLSEEVQGKCMVRKELQSTVCILLGSLTFLLMARSEPLEPGQAGRAETVAIGNHFVPALSFLFKCLPSLHCCNVSAKAIHQLCIHGQALLLAAASQGGGEPLVFALVEATLQVMQDSLALRAAREDVDKVLAALLLVIEGVVRALTALPPHVASGGIFRFAAQIERCLAEELAAPASAARVELLLKHAAQVVRFADIAAGPNETHILAGFLTHLWPRLTQLEVEDNQVYSSSPAVMSALLDFYGRTLMSAGTLLLSEVPRITQTVVNVFHCQGEASSAALQCASVIVEVLAGKGSPEIAEFLSKLLQNSVQVLAHHAATKSGFADSTKVFGYEPDCIEKFFRFVYAYLVSCPQILADCAALPQLSHLCVACFSSCRESSPLRTILHVVQTMYHPNFNRVSLAVHGQLIAACAADGQALVSQLLAIVAGAGAGVQSGVMPNVQDSLHSIVSGCHPDHTETCKMWVFSAFRDIGPFAKLGEHKQFAFDKLFLLAGDNRTKFKALLADLGKICADEVGVECLVQYQ